MTFNSFTFCFLFAPAVITSYWVMPPRWRRALLLAASYFFYGFWDYRFLSLIALSTLVDFFAAIYIADASSDRRRKIGLAVSLAMNLGSLAFFKYAGFFVSSASDALAKFGLQPNEAFLRIALPVGISFYTFQTLSYTFDVYRRELEPTRNLLTFAVFVAYFPQLVAGPIERASHLIPQIETQQTRPRPDALISGLVLILSGLVKKIVIADQAAVVADRVFAAPATFNSTDLALGAVAFSLQIYGDFSGYTNIARGTSRLLGIELNHNFTEPFLSRNITELWGRWHISLSAWLRDYLYRPLGGNRRGALRTYQNLMITMILGGLWHGAGWTFLAWGALHGLALSIHRWFTGGGQPNRPFIIGLRDISTTATTFAFFSFTLIIFRAESMSKAFEFLGALATNGIATPSGSSSATVAMAVLGLLTYDVLRRNHYTPVPAIMNRPLTAGTALGFVAGMSILLGGSTFTPFFYFQF